MEKGVGKFRMSRMDYGLITKWSPTSLPPGALQSGANCRLDGQRIGTNVGFSRLATSAPNDVTYRLDGTSQFFRGKVTAADNYTALQQTNFTIEFVFRADTNRAYQVVLYRGIGESPPTWTGGVATGDFSGAAGTVWAAYLRPNATIGNLNLYFYWYTGAAEDSIAFGSGPTTVIPGHYYHAVVTRESGGPSWAFYLHEVGTSLGTANASGAVTAVPANGPADFYVGGMPNQLVTAPSAAVRDSDLTFGQFQGIVQEIRYWNVVRTTPQLEGADDRDLTSTEIANANLLMYQPLTGLTGDKFPSSSTQRVQQRYFFNDGKLSVFGGYGSANQGVLLELKPTRATWETATGIFGGAILGAGSARFDGRDSGLVVKDSYKYLTGIRAERLNTAGTVLQDFGALVHRENYTISLRAKRLADGSSNRDTVFQWTHIPSPDFTTNRFTSAFPGFGATAVVSPSAQMNIMLLEANNALGQFCATLWINNAGVIEAYKATTNIPGGIILGTSYAISMTYNKAANSWSVRVDALAPVAIALPAGHVVVSSPDEPLGNLYKYWMTLGRCIKRSRPSNTNTFDPNAVEVEYDYARTFDGVLDQVVICGEAIENAGVHIGASLGLHQYLANNEITRSNVSSLQAIVLSAWSFNEAGGDQAEDIGVLGNNIAVLDDPSHTHGRSGITTQKRRGIKCVADHHYRSPAGEVRKRIVIAGGTVYEIPPAYGPLVPLADGFRNDEQRKVSYARFLDGLFLCCGSRGGNYHLVTDQLYQAAIDPPIGMIPFGLSDQISKTARLKKGIYKYAFTYYSAITGKRSSVGSLVALEIKTNGANVLFGTTAEINQTYPKTVRPEAAGSFWKLAGASDTKEPWDMSYLTLAPNPSQFRFAGWYGTSAALDSTLNDFQEDWWEEQPIRGANADRKAKKKRVYFKADIDGTATKNPIIKDIESVSADEAVAIVEDVAKNRAFLSQREDGRIILNGCVAGGEHADSGGRLYGAYLWVGDFDPVANATMTVDTGTIDWDVGAFASADKGTNYTGTGQIGHGLKLPFSSDPQVTHLEIWRTLADGDDYRLAVRLPNGTPNWKDVTEDGDLTGEILDISASAPPSVQYVSEVAGRMIFAAAIGNEQRAYFSDLSKPWSVPAQNVVDFLDGSTLPITGLGGVNGITALFKADTLFALLPPTNPLVPFDIQTRYRDIGCLAHFGIVQCDGRLIFPGERGFYMFDGNTAPYISNVIEPTWHAFPSTYKPLMTGFWDRNRDTVVWGLASTQTTIGSDDSTGVPDVAATWCTTSPGTPDGDPTGWMALTGLQISAACAIQDATNTRRVFFADEYGYVYEWGVGTNYGVGTLTPRATAVSVIGSALTFKIPKVTSYTTLPEGYRGFFLAWRTGATTDVRQIISDDLGVTDAQIVLDHALSGIPQVGDEILIGSIETEATFGEFSPGGPEFVSTWTTIFFRQVKQTTSATWEMAWQGLGGVNAAYNEQSVAFSAIAAQHQLTGISNQRIDSKISTQSARGRRLTLRLRSRAPDKPFVLRDMSWNITEVKDNDGEWIPVT